MDSKAKRNRILSALEARLDALPLLPQVVARIISLDPASKGYVDDVESLLMRDPPLAFRLISLANRNRGDRTPTLTLREALVQLGAQTLAETITTLATMNVFLPSTQAKRNLWLHSIQVACAARRIAEMQEELRIKPAEAYLAGLLHDIGRFVLYDQSPEDLGAVDETGWASGQDILEAEVTICGLDHAELGWEACRKWKLPEKVSVLIRDHHALEEGDDRVIPPEVTRLLQLIQVSDVVSFALMIAKRGSYPEVAGKLDAFLRIPGLKKAPIRARDLEPELKHIDTDSRVMAQSILLAMD